jgi:DNA-binding NtrC family response regulator
MKEYPIDPFLHFGYLIVIDDEPSIVEMLETALGQFLVLTFSSGRRAVDWIQRHPSFRFELVICDYAMPEMNGVETLRKLRELRPCAKFILMSGTVIYEVDRLWRDNQFDGFLAKPFVLDQLETLVEETLTRESNLENAPAMVA